MSREIFRKVALERMASPDRLDHAVRLVGAGGWLVLLTLAALIIAGVVWASVTLAPVKVRGQGILIDEAGLVELGSEQGGLLQSIEIAPGDMVEEGQVIATLARSELRRELEGEQARLADRQDRFTRRWESQDARAALEEQADARRQAALQRTIATLERRLPLLQELAEELRPLAERGVVPFNRLLDAEIAVSDLEERIANLREEVNSIDLAADERDARRSFEALDDRLSLDEQIRLVARLEARLAEERVIRSTHTGRIVEMQVNVGDVLPEGGALATLTQAGETRQLVALMFMPPEEGKRIAPGMSAEIAPTTVEREVFGHIRAEVLAVAELPATPEGMRRVLQNDQLVQQLSLDGAPIQVRVRMEVDESTATGYAWSASDGPVSGVNAGTLLEGQIVLEERPIVDLLLPGVRQRLAQMFDGPAP